MTSPTVALGSLLTDIQPGFASGDDLAEGIFQIRMNNLSRSGELLLDKRRRVSPDAKKTSKCLLEPGDVLFNATNSPELVGKTAYFSGCDEPTVFSNHFIRLRTHEGRLDSSYLTRWLHREFQRGYFRAKAKQWVNQATFGQDRLVQMQIPLPPIEEQRRIAEVLDAAEALRVKRRNALAKLDSLSQAIFIDMFGDLASNLRGWPVRRVSEFVDSFQAGKSVAAGPDDIPGGYRVLKVSAVTSRRFRPQESKPVPSSYVPPSSHIVRAGDLLLSRANTTELVGACAFVDATPENHLLPDKLWRFVWRMPHRVEPLFVWHLLQGRRARKEIGDLATGSSGSMKNISQKKFMQLEVPVPPLELQQEFVSRLHAVRRLASSQTQGESALDTLFASLQQRAFRGEL